MNVSVIIPAFNNEALLRQNLSSVVSAIEEYRGGKVQLVISDDHSSDNTKQYLASVKASITEKNIECVFVEDRYASGFSNNVDSAVEHASGDVLVLLNTDVVPRKDFLQPLLAHFTRENVFAVGCCEETSDEEGHPRHYGRAAGYFSKGFIMHKATDSKIGSSTFWVSCGSGAFRKSVWNKLGGLDKLFNPFYWEDVDLSYRAVKSGYTILFEAKSVISHNHEKGVIKSMFQPYAIKKIAYRNQFIFFWKNVTDRKMLLLHLLWLPYHLVHALLRNDRAFLSGFFSALTSFSKTMRSRKESAKMFVVIDRKILNQRI